MPGYALNAIDVQQALDRGPERFGGAAQQPGRDHRSPVLGSSDSHASVTSLELIREPREPADRAN